jgi:hypothetical protein
MSQLSGKTKWHRVESQRGEGKLKERNKAEIAGNNILYTERRQTETLRPTRKRAPASEKTSSRTNMLQAPVAIPSLKYEPIPNMIEVRENPVPDVDAYLEVAQVASTILGEAGSKAPVDNSGVASLLSGPDKIRKLLVSGQSETTAEELAESKQHENEKGVNGPLASRDITREGPGMSSANTLNSDTPLSIVSHFQTLLMILNTEYPSAARSNRWSPQITWPYSLFKIKISSGNIPTIN